MTKINTATGDLVVPVVDQGQDAGLSRRGERGMVSAEWTVGIIAAVAIAGVLLAVVTDGAVKDAMLNAVLWIIKTFTKVG